MDLTQESVSREWNGDVDPGDGKLQLLRSEYEKRLDAIPKVQELVSVACFQHLINGIEQDLNKIYDCK